MPSPGSDKGRDGARGVGIASDFEPQQARGHAGGD